MAENDIPSLEKSLKYMAWSIKEISENLKKIVDIMKSLTENDNKVQNPEFPTSNQKQLNLPF